MTILAVASSHANTKWGHSVVKGAGPIPNYDTSNAGLYYNNSLSRGTIRALKGEGDPYVELSADASELWLHFEQKTQSYPGGPDTTVLKFMGNDGSYQIAAIRFGNAMGFYKSTDGVSLVPIVSGMPITLSTTDRMIIDVHVKIAASGGFVKVYINETLVHTEGPTNTSTNGPQSIRYINLSSPGAASFYSQIIVADQSTIGWRLAEIHPVVGSQNFSGWTGDYSALDDFTYSSTKTDFLSVNTNNAVSSFETSDVHSSLSVMTIEAVVFCARALAETGSAVDNIQLGPSIGGTFYPSGTLTIGEGNGEVIVKAIFSNNPATSSPWNFTAINNMQIGVKAIT
jgi:hypothetical protein